MINRFLIDALELGHNSTGISRVLSSLIPWLVRLSSDEVHVACTSRGIALLDESAAKHAVVVPPRLQSRWEQWDLPRLGARLGVSAIYSHRECGPLWGPPIVLHLTEDPEVRWRRDPPGSPRDYARRMYSRLLMRRAVQRAGVIAASTQSVARQLADRFCISSKAVSIIPLGVDLAMFCPAREPKKDVVFHLGSSDPRDRTVLVVDAWAAARAQEPSLPRLVIGGRLGVVEQEVRRRATVLGVDVDLVGHLPDDKLAARFRDAAVVVQPSSDEGFGLQPLEAIASGAPLVVTRAGAVIDVVGDAAIIRDSTADEVATGILLALAREHSLRPLARQRATCFSWDRSAALVLSCLTSAAVGQDSTCAAALV
jgi:glycosyltransferase involved in cell wall biosynthesis